MAALQGAAAAAPAAPKAARRARALPPGRAEHLWGTTVVAYGIEKHLTPRQDAKLLRMSHALWALLAQRSAHAGFVRPSATKWERRAATTTNGEDQADRLEALVARVRACRRSVPELVLRAAEQRTREHVAVAAASCASANAAAAAAGEDAPPGLEARVVDEEEAGYETARFEALVQTLTELREAGPRATGDEERLLDCVRLATATGPAEQQQQQDEQEVQEAEMADEPELVAVAPFTAAEPAQL
eukprot:TRINITY_DN4393_c0_g1_i2.p1 TRINITY_DN4393_c0_g1~~TRINITY_DN4393_c0_g1_i2.p1  ORF type:complete len:269 (-),score=90.56 TRINITY_DN4393_c0_g1_i2:51-785(-)